MARIPNADGPTQNGCSNAALPQISRGFRRRARTVEILPRGLSDRGGNGGMNSFGFRAATNIGKPFLGRSVHPNVRTPARVARTIRASGASNRRALAHRCRKRAVVEVVEFPADRHTVR